MTTTRPVGSPRPASPWPLLGREAELAEAARALRDPLGSGVLVAGASGTGRSRLAHECWRQAGRRGHPELRVTATPAARSVPLGALAHLLRPGTDGAPPALGATGQAPGRRPVLLLDDAHHLDPDSIGLLTSWLRTRRVALIATADTHRPPGWPDLPLHRVLLRALPQKVVADLVERTLDGAVEHKTVRMLHQASGGRPRDLRELVDGAVRQRTLVPEDGLWRLVGPLSPTPRLRALIEARLRHLDPQHRRLLERLAVCGRLPLDPPDRAAARSLAAEGWLCTVEEGPHTCAELAGPLYGYVLRETLPVQRSRRILRDQARRAGDQDTGPAGLLRSVRWRLDAADGVDPDEVERAVVLARRAQDHGVALRLARELARLRPRPRSLLLLAEELYEGGEQQEAERTVRRALDESTRDDERLAAVVLHTQSLAFGLLRLDEAFALNATARQTYAGHPDEPVLGAHESALWSLVGDVRQAERAWREVAPEPGSRADVVAAVPRVYCLAESGRTGDAVRAARRSRAARRPCAAADTMVHPALLVGAEARALAEAGSLATAEELARQGYDLAVDAGAGSAQTWLAEHLGWICYLRGRLHESRIWYASTLAHAREVGLRSGEWVGWCGQALAAAVCGDVDRAAQCWEEARSLRPGHWWRPEAAMVTAWLTAATGRLVRARGVALDAAAAAGRRGLRTAQSHLLCDAARLGAAAEAERPLRELAAGSDSALVAARAGLAQGLASDRPDRLERSARQLASLGAGLLAAESWTAAATAHARADAGGSAQAAQAHALAVLGSDSGACTPGLVPSSVRSRLTARELEVALAAASGLGNKEIAGHLSIAVRTVGNHLQRVYSKLEIAHRTALRTALRPPAPR
ncbi:LuxR C-terminal-related transcriptional regulator [Streptomyces caniferus]|uniref:LuxR C-terminal-related transcriptional regulator n=1 Tax=Streptomyces caniferus TaxID=285557 RepID=A0ABZ1VWZ1_9ACTN|nr:LuxR C-terminal-related transcriptional regulator [Streptomyces caniferus]